MSMVTEERITNKITTRLQGREGTVSVKGGAYNYAVAARAGPTGIIRMVETRINVRGQWKKNSKRKLDATWTSGVESE